MSTIATTWAANQRPDRPVDKLVLWAMADQPMPRGRYLCFASIATLIEFTGLDRKTVLAAVARLKDRWIFDTGERRGVTGQIIVWRLGVPGEDDETVPETGPLETVPETEQSRKRNSPVFPPKESQKRDTDPEREPERHDMGCGRDARSPEERITGQAGRRIDPEWRPTPELPEAVGKVVAGWPPGRLEEVLVEFRDFWLAEAGKRASKRDWDRTWWNRLRAVIARDRERKDRGHAARGGSERRRQRGYRDPLLERELAAVGGDAGMG